MLKLKVSQWLKNLKQFLLESFADFFAINGSVKAAALAYATLTSLVPLMVLSLGFVLAFPSLSVYFQALHQFLFRHFIPSSANVIQKYIAQFADNATKLSATGLIIFLISSVLLLFTMETVFNSIWRVKTTRKGLKAFLMYWAVLTLIPPIGVFVVALTVFLSSLPYVSSLMKILTIFAPFIITFFGYVFLYMTIPNCPVRFRHAATGALPAAFIFEITKHGFQLYVTNFSSDIIIYGVLSVIPMFLLWLYVAWLITILGASIAHRAGIFHQRG